MLDLESKSGEQSCHRLLRWAWIFSEAGAAVPGGVSHSIAIATIQFNLQILTKDERFPSAALQTIQGQKAKVVEEVGKMTGARNDRPEPLKWPWYSSEAICLNRMAEWSATRCAAMCSQADVLYILDCCSTEYLDLRGSYDAR